MTVIAFRDGILAADSGVFQGDVFVGTCEKIWRNADGFLGGHTGYFDESVAFQNWFMAGMKDAAPRIDDKSGNEGLIITPEGETFWIGDKGRRKAMCCGDFFALGCGYEIALGAMHAGLGAIEAVRIVTERHCHCAPPVKVESL